jgi:hypothetical protein
VRAQQRLFHADTCEQRCDRTLVGWDIATLSDGPCLVDGNSALLALVPPLALFTLVWMLALGALLWGLTLLALASRLRPHGKAHPAANT